MRNAIGLVALLILAAACTEKASPAFFYISKTGDVNRLYTQDEQGNTTEVPLETGRVGMVSLSPDGKAIAYMLESMDGWEIYRYDLATKTNINLTNSPKIEGQPAWNSDGSKLAFMTSDGGNRNIYYIDSDGERVQVTEEAPIETEPVWSLSSDSIIYFKAVLNNAEVIFQKNLESGKLLQISPNPGTQFMLKPRPESEELSFVRYSDDFFSLMIFDAKTGRNFSLLTTDQRISGYNWSPDGTRLAISIQGQLEVYELNAEGGLDLTQIIKNAAYPVWTPTGDGLVYNKRIDGILQLFRYGFKTGTERQLTQSLADATDPILLDA